MELPKSILDEFQKSIDSLNSFGKVQLTVVLHDDHPRFILAIEKSIVPGKTSSGAVNGGGYGA